jgi:hypothetical protein
MSKIKEQLIGYENSDWIDGDDHVKVTEVEDYLFYAMTVAEMQQATRQYIRHDLYTTSKQEFDRIYYDTIGVHTR